MCEAKMGITPSEEKRKVIPGCRAALLFLASGTLLLAVGLGAYIHLEVRPSFRTQKVE